MKPNNNAGMQKCQARRLIKAWQMWLLCLNVHIFFFTCCTMFVIKDEVGLFTNWSRQRLELSEDLLSKAVTFGCAECSRVFQWLLQRWCLFFFQSSSGGGGRVTEQRTRKWHFKVIVASARCRGLSLTRLEKNKTLGKKINIGCKASISCKENSQRGEAASAAAL